MSARTVLVCNGCGAVAGLTPLAGTRITRRKLKEKGWGYRWRGEDYCPDCLPKMITARKANGGYA